MNRRILLIFICALIGGASVSYLVYRMAGGSPRAPAPMAQVVVAARDLPVGTLIGPSDVRMLPWAGTVPKGALSKVDLALSRGVTASMYEGEPIMADRLAAAGSGGGLAAIIPPGMRATAVRVNDVVGLAGFVTAGMRVDVLMSGMVPGGNAGEGPHVSTLLQNIQVLSAGENLQKDSEGKPHLVQVVNLLVTPDQAEKLTLAGNQTQIQLVLRNPLDTQTTTPPGTSISELFGKPAAPQPRPPESAQVEKSRAARGELGLATSAVARPAEVPARKVHVVEVYNGAAKTEVTFTLPEDSK